MSVSAPLGFLISTKVHPWKKLHIWTGDDTACRMYSTGGLSRADYVQTPIFNPETEEICQMCKAAEDKTTT